MEPRIANDYAPQPASPSESHARAAEYRAYRNACIRQLVTAAPFASWLSQTEEFENGRSCVFQVTSRKAALAPGWYKNVFAPKTPMPRTFGPFPTARAAEAA